MEDLRKVAEELGVWWDSFSQPTRNLFRLIVASLPGGEELEDAAFGGEDYVAIPLPALGFREAELLARVLQVLKEPGDVQFLARAIVAWDRALGW